MKMLWMLAAAATLAACHNRGEDEMGAAPDRGDTAAVDTTIAPTTPSNDTSMVPMPTPTPVDTGMTPTMPSDTMGGGEYPTTPTDTTTGQYPAPPTGATPDSSTMPNDSGMSSDTGGYSPETGVDSSTDSTQSPQ